MKYINKNEYALHTHLTISLLLVNNFIYATSLVSSSAISLLLNIKK